MIDAYIEQIVQQELKRARILKTKIPNPGAAELMPLQNICEERIDRVIEALEYLLTDSLIRSLDLRRERLRLVRRTIADLTRIETTAIPTLIRPHEDDVFLNRIVFEIHREIGFPLLPPTATCLSHDYFSIDTSLRVLHVPPAEADFLLHLPDLYHELGHLLIATSNNPKVEPFQVELGKFMRVVSDHLQEERKVILRSTGPIEYFQYELERFERFWLHWAMELFCDLFAVATLGPAFLWAHLHLTAMREGDPFDVSLARLMTHPPDQARTEVGLMMLDILGLRRDAKAINRKWTGLVEVAGGTQTNVYRKACPKDLLEQAVIHSLEGVKGIGCRVVDQSTQDSIHRLLNDSWMKFWREPATYSDWEQEKLSTLRKRMLPPVT